MSKPTVRVLLSLIRLKLKDALNTDNPREVQRLVMTTLRYTEKALDTTQEEIEVDKKLVEQEIEKVTKDNRATKAARAATKKKPKEAKSVNHSTNKDRI